MKYLIFIIGCLCCLSCSKNNILSTESSISNEIQWIHIDPPYPIGETGLFPLITTPLFKSVSEFSNLNDTDKVAIVSFKDKIKVYPYLYVNRSEIINDTLGGYHYAVSYCPQTKSAINFDRIVQNDTLELVASGLLYKDNLVPSDKNYILYWSQMLQKGITSNADTKQVKTLNLIQTNWKTVVDHFPNAQVFYYEGDIVTPRISKQSSFPKTTSNISNAAQVFSIIENLESNGKQNLLYAFPIDNYSTGISLRKMHINNLPTLIVGSKQHHFFTTFIIPTGLNFSLENKSFPPILIDNEGSRWNTFGYAMDGPRKGTQLTSAKSYTASWWALKAFFKNISLQ